MDISLGINDLWSDENGHDASVEDIKIDLQEAISKIKLQKPNTLFMLTMPNRKYLPENVSNSDYQSGILRETYLQLSSEMNIPLVDVMGEIMPSHASLEASWYRDDNIHYHLTALGQQLISDLILSNILNSY